MIFEWIWNLIRPPQRPKVRIICMPQSETWTWPARLGAKTAGNCADCGVPIFFEKQNARFEKVCYHCGTG